MLVAWFTLWVIAMGSVFAADPVPQPEIPIEDPRRLARMGEEALQRGDRDQAKSLFEQTIAQMEVTKYLDFRAELRDALVLERMGDFEGAAAAYRVTLDRGRHQGRRRNWTSVSVRAPQ